MLAIFAASALIAVALSAYAATGRLAPGDLRITHDLQATPGGGTLAAAAEAIYLARYPLTALVAAYAAWRRRPALVLAAVFVLLALALNPLLKDLVDRPRPSAADGVIIREHASGTGYPSGHSMSIALLSGYSAVVGCRLLPRAVAVAGVIVETAIVLLVGWMRVYNGAHWPSDVLGGWTIGLALLFVCFAVASWAGRARRGAMRPRAMRRRSGPG